MPRTSVTSICDSLKNTVTRVIDWPVTRRLSCSSMVVVCVIRKTGEDERKLDGGERGEGEERDGEEGKREAR